VIRAEVAIALAVAACSHPPKAPATPEPADAATPVDAAVPIVDAPPALGRTRCDQQIDWRPPTFASSGRVVRLRVAAARFGVTWGHDRCVELDLELVDSYRGASTEHAGDHLKIIVRQSTITHYTSRPAGAWWVIEQTLEPTTEYVAFCPAGPLATTLIGSCRVTRAVEVLADVELARGVETSALGFDATVAKAHAECPRLSYVAAQFLWERLHAEISELALYRKLLELLEDPRCAETFRATLLDAVELPAPTRPQAIRLAQAMFRLLAESEAADLHDNLVATWLPTALGLDGAAFKLTAAEVFAREPTRRTAARSALAAYKGPADTQPLRAWLR